jgi:hypothetical protein
MELMIHDVSVGTNDVERAPAFYDPVLAASVIRAIKTDDRELLSRAANCRAGLFTDSSAAPRQ